MSRVSRLKANLDLIDQAIRGVVPFDDSQITDASLAAALLCRQLDKNNAITTLAPSFALLRAYFVQSLPVASRPLANADAALLLLLTVLATSGARSHDPMKVVDPQHRAAGGPSSTNNNTSEDDDLIRVLCDRLVQASADSAPTTVATKPPRSSLTLTTSVDGSEVVLLVNSLLSLLSSPSVSAFGSRRSQKLFTEKSVSMYARIATSVLRQQPLFPSRSETPTSMDDVHRRRSALWFGAVADLTVDLLTALIRHPMMDEQEAHQWVQKARAEVLHKRLLFDGREALQSLLRDLGRYSAAQPNGKTGGSGGEKPPPVVPPREMVLQAVMFACHYLPFAFKMSHYVMDDEPVKAGLQQFKQTVSVNVLPLLQIAHDEIVCGWVLSMDAMEEGRAVASTPSPQRVARHPRSEDAQPPPPSISSPDARSGRTSRGVEPTPRATTSSSDVPTRPSSVRAASPETVLSSSTAKDLRTQGQAMLQVAEALIHSAEKMERLEQQYASVWHRLRSAEADLHRCEEDKEQLRATLTETTNRFEMFRVRAMEESAMHADRIAMLLEDNRLQSETLEVQQRRIDGLEKQVRRYEQMNDVIRTMTTQFNTE